MSQKPKILYVVHNHPSLFPGGSELYALELYRAMRAAADFEPLLIARADITPETLRRTQFESVFQPLAEDANQYLFYADRDTFDPLFGTQRNKYIYTRYYREFLQVYQPDIVHFQHTLFLGYDILRETRATLPNAGIVYTLHEYLPICHNNGQMVRTMDKALCRQASPQRCNECFPQISPQTFFLRKRFIQSHFDAVDMFVAPSYFLLERYVDWGIPRTKIRYEPNGRQPMHAEPETPGERPRNRIAFFGQLTPFKGLSVLLEAMLILEKEGSEAHLWLHGPTQQLDSQSGEFQNEIRPLIEATRSHTTMAGQYERSELATLMAKVDWVVIPSIWWENSPLVIQEAFAHGRPVICSDIGGMAEKVHDGVNGLHFRRGDPTSLAAVIQRAVTTPGLWEQLRAGIPPVHRMADSVEVLSDLYRGLLQHRGGAGGSLVRSAN